MSITFRGSFEDSKPLCILWHLVCKLIRKGKKSALYTPARVFSWFHSHWLDVDSYERGHEFWIRPRVWKKNHFLFESGFIKSTHTYSVGECRSKPLYSDHNVGILWAARRKNGVRDLTRRSDETSWAKLARNTRDWGVCSVPVMQGSSGSDPTRKDVRRYQKLQLTFTISSRSNTTKYILDLAAAGMRLSIVQPCPSSHLSFAIMEQDIRK